MDVHDVMTRRECLHALVPATDVKLAILDRLAQAVRTPTVLTSSVAILGNMHGLKACDAYARNIQTANLNALNAVLAINRFIGVYADATDEGFFTRSMGPVPSLRDDREETRSAPQGGAGLRVGGLRAPASRCPPPRRLPAVGVQSRGTGRVRESDQRPDKCWITIRFSRGDRGELVPLAVEAGRPAASGASIVSVSLLVHSLRDGVLDSASSQVTAVRSTGLRPVLDPLSTRVCGSRRQGKAYLCRRHTFSGASFLCHRIASRYPG